MVNELVAYYTANKKLYIEQDNSYVSLDYDQVIRVRDFINENLEKIKPSEEEKKMNELIDLYIDIDGNLVFYDNDGKYVVMTPIRMREIQAWLQENPEFLNPKPKYDFPPDFKPGTILKHTENYGWAFHDAKNLVTSLVYMKLLIDVPEVPEGTPLDTVFIKD